MRILFATMADLARPRSRERPAARLMMPGALMRRIRLLLPLAFAAVLMTHPSPTAANGPLGAERADAVRTFVRNAVDQLGVPGTAVVVVGRDGIEFAEGFGSARDDGTPVTPQTPFHIASVSKQLTSIAVMQLVESGDLSLDATVRSYIDWFGADGSDTAKITVRDLLAHTSGWSGWQGLTNRIDESHGERMLELNARRLASEPLTRPIGQFEYSNANYDVLGYLLAVVSGVSYEDYMTEHVLGPLKMTHSHLSDAEARADGLAQGHYPFFGIPIAYDIPFVRGSLPSSFIAASAEDLGHVLIAHLNGGAYEGMHVLEASGMARLRQPLTHPDPWDGYGWGWWTYPLWDAGGLKDAADISQYEVPVMLEHNGSHSTYASGILLLPEQGIGVVVLMNLNDEITGSRFNQLHPGIAQIMLGRDAPALTSYDEPLAQYGKVIGAAWVVALAVLIAWSLRRYRRWQHEPAATPRGRWAVARRMVLPLLLDAALVVGFWWLLSTRELITMPSLLRLVRLWPDAGLVLIAVTVLGIGWALVGTIWTVRLLRRGARA
jgi:CubicO group peptidase (beta-lactamase class C family)